MQINWWTKNFLCTKDTFHFLCIKNTQKHMGGCFSGQTKEQAVERTEVAPPLVLPTELLGYQWAQYCSAIGTDQKAQIVVQRLLPLGLRKYINDSFVRGFKSTVSFTPLEYAIQTSNNYLARALLQLSDVDIYMDVHYKPNACNLNSLELGFINVGCSLDVLEQLVVRANDVLLRQSDLLLHAFQWWLVERNEQERATRFDVFNMATKYGS